MALNSSAKHAEDRGSDEEETQIAQRSGELAADAIPGDVEQAAQQAAQNAEQANAEQAIADLQERQEILDDFILRCFSVVYSAVVSTVA